jgi:hypothetical protein
MTWRDFRVNVMAGRGSNALKINPFSRVSVYPCAHIGH